MKPDRFRGGDRNPWPAQSNSGSNAGPIDGGSATTVFDQTTENVDGGSAPSIYGGTTAIDGGTA